ncbi:glycosyltransferase family 39 protein [Hymenobacter sp. NBH84]|uniref:glycosyltransferase family 39 protein n=1 Tax=Hymenobacter sp. NBH84 TaxID=2596915 RepID=UPI001627523C|nr:glycosyltransferase family 39 protein [Hymenobacter sp. NBH84]QNE41281.1 glycosyltransferase family 39 protein [Hymenobacter sp. NBH84]
MAFTSFAAANKAALKHPYHIAAAVLLLATSALFYVPYLHELPTGVHTWAQSDRLALAINFYDYGFHFLTPRTSSLTSIDGVTGVEFPLPAYLAALGGVIFGRDAISGCFRTLDVLMVTVGFFYLFRLIYDRTGHFVAGLLPAAFLFASPTYAFYAGNFVPDPFSLSLSFIGYYYWLRFFEQRRFPDLRIALSLLVLAGLIKTTTALHFGAVVGITMLWAFVDMQLLQQRQRLELVIWAVSGVGLIGFFFLHNQHLNTTYQSWQFIANPNPVADPDAWHAIVQSIRRDWLTEYLTRVHYFTLAVCIVLLFVFIRPTLRRYLPLTLLLLLSIGIAYLFVQVMGGGLGGHDYHMICSFGPPTVLLLVVALLNIGRYVGRMRYATSIGLGILGIFFVVSGYKRFNRRMSDNYPPFSLYYSHIWMRGGAAELKQAGVSPTARVLILEEAVNTPQIYFDRRGIAWKPSDPSALSPADFLNPMSADSLEYLIMRPETYAQLAPIHAGLAQEFTIVARRPGVVLRRRDMSRSW